MKTTLNISVLATLLVVMPEASSTGRTASASDRLALEQSGESPAGTNALESLRERLQKEVGGQWRLRTSRAGFKERPTVWATLLTWFNMTVPYVIAPASKSDNVGERPKDFEGALALEVVATDHRYTVCAGPSYEPEVMAKVLSIAGLTLSKEAGEYRLRHGAADWLDFRLAVTDQPGAVEGKSVPLAHGPSLSQIQDYTKLFAEKGPNAGRQRGDPYVWFPRLEGCDLWPSLVTTSNRGAPYERLYVLLSDKPEQVLLSGSRLPRPWSLKRVQAGEDATGRPAVVMELDSVAAERMAKLTRSNPGCALAVLFNNSVVQMIVLESKPSDRVVLSGNALDKALVARVVRSLSECMMDERNLMIHGFKVGLRPDSYWPVAANICVPSARLDAARAAIPRLQAIIAARLAGLEKDDIEQRDRRARHEDAILADTKGQLANLSIQSVLLSLDIK